MPSRVAQTVRPDLSQQHASRAGDRTFTGNANLRPATGMEPLTADTAQRLSTSAAVPKPLASTQPAFTIGSATAPVSPSKKRMHNALKTRQGSASASTTLPPRANPFAQYGVASGVSSSQAGRTSAQGSPVAAQSGFGSPQPSPRRSLKTVRRSDGAQGMNIDLITPLEAAAAEVRSTTSQPAASSAFNGSATQPLTQPESPSSTAASSFFAQNLSAPLSTQASFQTGTGPNGQTRSAKSGSSAQQQAAGTSASASAAAGTAASCFSFGSAQAEIASDAMPSPQRPFQRFGLHADSEQAAPDTPSARFPGFQPGIQSRNSISLT